MRTPTLLVGLSIALIGCSDAPELSDDTGGGGGSDRATALITEPCTAATCEAVTPDTTDLGMVDTFWIFEDDDATALQVQIDTSGLAAPLHETFYYLAVNATYTQTGNILDCGVSNNLNTGASNRCTVFTEGFASTVGEPIDLNATYVHELDTRAYITTVIPHATIILAGESAAGDAASGITVSANFGLEVDGATSTDGTDRLHARTGSPIQ